MGLLAGIGVLAFVIILGLIIFLVAAMWKVYVKAGEEGWKCIIPIYNAVVLLKIVGKPWWWIFLMIVPFVIGAIINMSAALNGTVNPVTTLIAFAVNIVGYVYVVWTYNMLSKSFGKSEGFTAGMLFLGFIFIPILGFGDARYLGPYGDKAAFEAYGQKGRFDFEDDKFSN